MKISCMQSARIEPFQINQKSYNKVIYNTIADF